MFNDFDIHLEALKIGEHKFKFLLDKTFFESKEYSLIETGNLTVELKFVKKERLSELFFSYDGTVNLHCDTCGGKFDYPIDFSDETILKYGEENYIDDGVWVIDNSTKELDIAQYLYESLCLEVPKKVSHEDSLDEECDKEVLEKLADLSQANNNKIDPRWDALSKLK